MPNILEPVSKNDIRGRAIPARQFSLCIKRLIEHIDRRNALDEVDSFDIMGAGMRGGGIGTGLDGSVCVT